MIKLLAFFLLSILSHGSLAQKLVLDIHFKRLPDFIRLEQRYGSERVVNQSNSESKSGVAQPVIFRRKETKVPDLLVYYFFFEKDSTIHDLLYEWDEVNWKRHRKNALKSEADINGFIGKYQEIHQEIFQLYGESQSKGNLFDLAKIKTGDFEKNDSWKPNDSTEIELSMVLSSKFEKRGSVTINPTYRIRLDVRNLDPRQEMSPTPLKEERIKELDLVAQAFLSDLKKNNYIQAKVHLSDLIRNTVTDVQLEQLAKSIHLEKRMEIYFQGTQTGMDGSVFSMLQYKYATETQQPPKEMIKILFDEKGKIAGLQPLQSH